MDGEQTTLEQDGPIRSSHKSGHMTARMQRIELITRGERRRRWSIEEKREIVADRSCAAPPSEKRSSLYPGGFIGIA